MLIELQVQEFIIVKDSITKKKLRKVAVDQEYVELAPVLIIVQIHRGILIAMVCVEENSTAL